jgi:hypothetical protein
LWYAISSSILEALESSSAEELLDMLHHLLLSYWSFDLLNNYLSIKEYLDIYSKIHGLQKPWRLLRLPAVPLNIYLRWH